MATIIDIVPPRSTRNAGLVTRIRRETDALDNGEELRVLLAWVKLEGPATGFADELGMPAGDLTARLATAMELLRTDERFARRFFRINASFYTSRDR